MIRFSSFNANERLIAGYGGNTLNIVCTVRPCLKHRYRTSEYQLSETNAWIIQGI